MPTLIHRRVESARGDANPAVICRMRSGWAVLGDTQFLRGYALLLADPVVQNLNAVGKAARDRPLMRVLAEAIGRGAGSHVPMEEQPADPRGYGPTRADP